MKVIINAASIYKGGAEQVVNSFINECKNFPQHKYHILLGDNIYQSLERDTFKSNFHFYRVEKRTGASIINIVKTVRYFNRLEKKIKPDVVISTGGHGYWIPEVPLISGFNIPHYVYPESPYFQRISTKQKIYWKLKKQFDLFFYRQSDAIIVQTNDVSQRVKKLLPEVDIYTVSNTVNGVFLSPVYQEKKLPPRKEGEVRLLTVSSYYEHKNLDIILEVVGKFKEVGVKNVKFILTLPESAFEIFKNSKYREFIINVGPLPIAQCPSLYNECDMMFLPTLLECFSASYVEAMAMGKPIITSDLPFARTVCKEAAVYFDPMDPADIADKIRYLVLNPLIQKELVYKGNKILSHLITPAERTEKFLSICENQLTNQ